MVIIACSVPGCWPLVAHLSRKSKSNTDNIKRKASGPNNHRSYPLHSIGGTFHASAEGNRAASHEAHLMEHGIVMRKDLCVHEEMESELRTPGPRRESSPAENDARDAISVTERV